MNIIIVDDDPFFLKLTAAQCRGLGASRVIPCESVASALDAIKTLHGAVDVLFADLQMPGTDGVQLIRELGEQRFRGEVVLVSGEGSRVLSAAEKLARAHRLRVLGAFCKPVTSEQIAGVFTLHAERSSAKSAQSPKVYSVEDLRGAIARRELVNFYQPKVDRGSGALLGVESLVRWKHPQDGMVFPDRFIGVAERYGLIDELTRYVLREALGQGHAWSEAGMDLFVAVNVSMDNLSDLTFPEFVAQASQETGFPLNRLVLEVTESKLIQDLRSVLDILTRLQLKRARISIDDFGTGHSSLAQLRDLPFDELKIDRGFVRGAHRETAIRAIFEASERLARDLKIDLVAEGVEDEADWRFLGGRGTLSAQGYFIARPMPASDLAEWFRGWELRRSALLAHDG